MTIFYSHRHNKEKFEEYIEKAITLSKTGSNKERTFYLLALKYDHMTRFEEELEHKLEYLAKARGYYYKVRDTLSGKIMEVRHAFIMAQLKVSEGKYEEALRHISK